MHPPFVHFVVALPVVALFSQFTYLVTKDPAYSKAALRIIGFTMLVSFFALFSGINDAEKLIKAHNIIQEGVAVLQNHKIIGFIVVALLVLTSLTKWFAVSKRSSTLEMFSLLLIILTLAISLYQGRGGGSLVYQYSGGIDKSVIIQRTAEQQK